MAQPVEHHRSLVWSSSVLVGAAIALVAGRAEGATPSCPYGVNAHQAPNDTLDLAAAAGIGWVRFDMNWIQFEPEQGNFQWTEADRFVDHASSLGLNVFMTVAYSPTWAVPGPCNEADPNPANKCHTRPPASVSYWTDFLTAAVARYGDRVKAWGMWNEPNLGDFFQGTRDEYVNGILVPGSAAVHAACADCQVMGPELANLRGASWDANEGTCIGSECAFNGWNYSLIHVLEAAGSSIDVVTHHKYQDPATEWWLTALQGQWQVIQLTNGIKEVTDLYAPGKPVWITEFGWEANPSDGAATAYAADQLTQMYQDMALVIAGTMPNVTNQPWPELKKLFWYDVQDDPNGYYWGLVDASGVPKAPYDAYAAVIAQLGDCSGAAGAGGAGGNGAGGSNVGGSGTAGGGPNGGSGTGAGPAGGNGAGANGSGGDSASLDEESGCGCRVPGPATQHAPAALALVVGMAALARPRRRRLAR